jgi:cell migration-inducing and hyaluronan-binding protein
MLVNLDPKESVIDLLFGANLVGVTTGGTLTLIGKKFGVSWSHLSANAYPGATTIQIDDTVTWPVGSKIVLATTDFSEVIDSTKIPASSSINWRRGKAFADQNEVLTVASISGNVLLP